MKKWIILSVLVVVAVFSIARMNTAKDENRDIFANVSQILSGKNQVGEFEQAIHEKPITFPDALGSHDSFQTEWWYFTGNLSTKNGIPFGYQLTFFRRAIRGGAAKGSSKWRTNQVYLGHFAVSDIGNDVFLSFERYSRASVGLAGADRKPFRVWLENWEVAENSNGEWELRATEPGVNLYLTLKLLKPMIFNGKRGLSRKGPEKGNASYYFSNTRIDSKGVLRIQDHSYQVSGFSWMDREWSTSLLGRNQIGWDWFSIQLDDWREIMLFQIREAKGGISKYSSGSFVDKDGQKTHLDRGQFEISVQDRWRSPATGILYPSSWNIRIPLKDININIVPMMKDQEHRLSFAYWEGAVEVKGEGGPGNGYVEMTGYAR